VKHKVYHGFTYVLSYGGSQSQENEVKRGTHYVSQQIMIKHDDEDQVEYKVLNCRRPTLKRTGVPRGVK
jgi:hypothetical protein